MALNSVATRPLPALARNGDDRLPVRRTHPVVVGSDQCAVVIAQLQRRILQWVGNSMLGQRWAYDAYNHSRRHVAPNNEAVDHDVVAGLHQAARGDVG